MEKRFDLKKYRKKYYQANKEKIRIASKRTYERNKVDILQRHKVAHAIRDIRELIVQRAKRRSKIKEITFDIVKEDIVVPTHCPILGIPIKVNKGGRTASFDSPSLDRIVPTEGYVKGNIQVISYKANAMKNNATVDELKKFANWVTSSYGPYIEDFTQVDVEDFEQECKNFEDYTTYPDCGVVTYKNGIMNHPI